MIGGIPRLLLSPHRRALVANRLAWFRQNGASERLAAEWGSDTATTDDRTVADFDYEWAHASRVGTSELSEVFGMYFEQVPTGLFSEDKVALDAGCGAGRWAYEVALRGPRVIAVDLGLSVEIAWANTRKTNRVACVQADIRALPLAPGCVDWSYSLGVVHHLNEPHAPLRQMVRTTRQTGLVVSYLYYALDERGIMYRALFRTVDVLRRGVSRLPRPVVRAISTILALCIYLPLARAAAVLEMLGFDRASRTMPLSFYRRLPLRLMISDSLDRFGTRIEHRFTRQQFAGLLEQSGLVDVTVSPNPPYWHGLGRVPKP